jgi:hypothetical protein
MRSAEGGAASGAARVMDVVAAALSAAWPRSTAGREIARAQEEGFTAGETCDIAFSLAFTDPGTAVSALGAAQAAGFTVGELGGAAKGFVTVQAPVRLRAWDLALATSRLSRIAAEHGGWAVVVGPVGATPAAESVETPARASSAA